MLQKNELLSPPSSPLPDTPTPDAAPDSTERPTRWLWIVGVAAVVVLAAAAVLWWLLGSTVSQDLYDETVAELTATEEAMVAAEANAAELQAQVADLRQETAGLESAVTAGTDRIAELEALSEELQNQIMSAQPYAEYVAYRYLDWSPEDIAAMQEVGDTAAADALIEQLGETGAWMEWVNSGGWVGVGESIARIDDDAMSAAWGRFNAAEHPSPEGMAAIVEVDHHVARLLLEALADG